MIQNSFKIPFITFGCCCRRSFSQREIHVTLKLKANLNRFMNYLGTEFMETKSVYKLTSRGCCKNFGEKTTKSKFEATTYLWASLSWLMLLLKKEKIAFAASFKTKVHVLVWKIKLPISDRTALYAAVTPAVAGRASLKALVTPDSCSSLFLSMSVTNGGAETE
jgi:hypothetical protein